MAGARAGGGIGRGRPLSLDEDAEDAQDARPTDAGDPVAIPITDELDLHTFAPRDLPSVVAEYVQACREKGILRVRVIHGRGKGVARAEVQRTLRALPGVVSFADAPPASGGWGATVVHLAPAAADSDPL